MELFSGPSFIVDSSAMEESKNRDEKLKNRFEKLRKALKNRDEKLRKELENRFEKLRNRDEKLKNRFKKLSDETLLELYANPELLKEIVKDFNYSFKNVLHAFCNYIIDHKFNSGQKIIYNRYIEQNSIFENPTPRVLNAIRFHFKNNLKENIDNLNDNEILATIYIVSLYNKRKKDLKEYLTTLDINTLSDMLDYKLSHETDELSNKYYVNIYEVMNSIEIEFENRTVAIRSFLSKLDINDLLKFFLSRETLQYCSYFDIYYEEKINNLNEKRIADLSEKFSIPIDIIKKLIFLEINSRIKILKKILDEHDASSGIPSNTSLANTCHLNEEIVANYIKNQNEKSPNFVSSFVLGLKPFFKIKVEKVSKFCNSLEKCVTLNLPKEYSNAVSYIIDICNKYKSNELENKILHRIIEIFEATSPRPSNYNPFFKEVLKNFPSLKDENPNFNKINLEFTISIFLNCDDFDLIANSLDLSIEQFKNICLHIINLSGNESENEILNFCIDNMNTNNLNFQDYNSFVEFFTDLFETFPNILQLENNKNKAEIIETHEFNNTEPKPELELDNNQQEKDK